MLISDEEFNAIVVAASGHNDFHRVSTNQSREIFARPRHFRIPVWASDFREMLNGLVQLEFSPEQASPLQKVCKAGSEYGLRVLKKTVSSELLSILRPKAKRHIKNDLRRILARVTRPCLALELNAFRCVYEAVYPQKGSPTPKLLERKFLGERPYDRLISLFKEFPGLAELWSQLIYQWCDSVADLLARVERDEQRVSRVFFRGQPVGKIIDLRAGLSDPHNKGRTVMRVQFQAGSIIYKPRCGHGEEEWFSLIDYLNAASLRPKLSAAKVLCRDGLIASGEHPVLVDAETLWHLGGERKKKGLLDPLYGTGFLPTSGRRSSYQYRSSALGKTPPGKHTPYIGTSPLRAARYEIEIVDGFCRAWRCLLGTRGRRTAFSRRLQRVRGRERRRIYWSTGDYDAIMRASIQSAALRSGVDRNMLIARLCGRSTVSQRVIREEINALKRLDIPYFIRGATAGSPLPEDNACPPEIIEALRRAVHL